MIRFYRLVLRVLPTEFRTAYGREMEQMYRDRLADERGLRRRLSVIAGSIVDVLVQSVLERRGRALERAGGAAAGRHAGRGRWLMDGTRQDLRQSLRSIMRTPSFAALAIATLALGIGAATAVFSVVYALLLRPLPYEDPGRLVAVWPDRNFNKTMVHRVAEAVPALESVSGISIWSVTVSGDGADAEEVNVALVSANHFDVLQTKPVMGRSFAVDEGRMGNEGVLVLSHDYWARRFGSDPSIIGRTVRMAGAGHDQRTVIGVMPRGFRPVHPTELAGWVPLEDSTGVVFATDNSWYVNWRVGRLAKGATIAQANAQMRAVAAVLHDEWPEYIDEQAASEANVQPLRADRVGDVSASLWILLGSVTLVLLISCANVANLLLARGEARLREFSVRKALGASTGRVARQLFTEALVLAAAGAGAGIAVAFGLLRLILANAPADLPDAGTISIDPVVLAFALGVSLLSAVVFGVAPILRARGTAAADSLRQGSRGATGSRTRNGMSGMLVGTEVALAVLLVVGAGLMLRSLGRMNAVDPGFQPEGVLAFRVTPPPFRYGNATAIRGFYDELNSRLAELPQVESVAGIQLLPVTVGNWAFGIHAEGHPVPSGTPAPNANFRVITPGYFETLGIPLIRGRTILTSDRTSSPPSAVINQTMANQFFPGEDPIGRTLHMFSANGMPFTVVGIVGDVHQRSLTVAPRPEMYVPHEQLPWDVTLWTVLRARGGDPLALAPLVRMAVQAIDPDAPISGLQPMAGVIGDSAATTRFITMLLGFFGVTALALGAIGVYGVTAYTVARRIPEFGLRLALGASRRDVLASAGSTGIAPVLLGILAGCLAAFFGARLLEGLLFEVGPRDPLAFAGAPIVLALAGLAATLIPAWRATRIDPADVLRSD